MIRHTFRIADGIGERLERHLWKESILCWEDFLITKRVRGISPDRKSFYDREFSDSIEALERKDERYFFTKLKQHEYWRLFDALKDNAVYLDIETTGLNAQISDVTIVGLFDGLRSRVLVKGIDLTVETLRKELEGYKMIITYYGSVFDIPFLKKKFPTLSFNLPHFDLCFSSHRAGFKGGLKRLEEDLGIMRSSDIKGLDGYDAVKLWIAHLKGNDGALDLLMRYNEEDTKNLFLIAKNIYKRLRGMSGFDGFALETLRKRSIPEKFEP
ncbi:MAG: ribonuclease H-like domain-containing protein [Nitrospirota bacterium]